MNTSDMVNRVSSILAAAPFSFTQATEPFGLDLQPNTHLDRVFCIVGQLEDVTPYLGLAQAQVDRLTINIARKFNRAPHAAVATLDVDVSSLQSAVVRDGTAGDYNGYVVDWNVRDPEDADNFAVAEIQVLVDYDRLL
jgi:hypothetical protein